MSGMSYQEIMKYTSNLSEHMYQCEKCGRKEIIRAGETKKLCTHCGNYIFKTKKDEFIYRMRGEMINGKIGNK